MKLVLVLSVVHRPSLLLPVVVRRRPSSSVRRPPLEWLFHTRTIQVEEGCTLVCPCKVFSPCHIPAKNDTADMRVSEYYGKLAHGGNKGYTSEGYI